jgi:hypothetical protein
VTPVRIRHLTSTVAIASLVVVMGLPFCGCKSVACHDYALDGGLDDVDLKRMQNKVAAGTDPCPELASPRVEVGDHGLALNGHVIAPVSELPTSTGRRIDALFERLKSDHYLWIRLHPGQELDAHIAVTFPGDMDAVPAASVIQSVCFAGYKNLHIRVANDELTAPCGMPLLPDDGANAHECADVFRVAVEKRADGTLDLRFGQVRSERVEAGWGTSMQLPNLEAVANAVSAGCAARPALGPSAFSAYCGVSTAPCPTTIIVRGDGAKLITLVELARDLLNTIHAVPTTEVTFAVPGLWPPN